MTRNKRRKLNLNSIIAKFLLAFFLFGSLLVMVTVAIQKDLADATAEEHIIAQENMSLSVLEGNLADGDWNVRDGMLYKGDMPVGNGSSISDAEQAFDKTKNETGFYVGAFLDCELADTDVLASLAPDGNVPGTFLLVAGRFPGSSIDGIFLDPALCEELEENGSFAGRTETDGHSAHCLGTVLKDGNGKPIGVLTAGQPIGLFTAGQPIGLSTSGKRIDVIDRQTKISTRNSSLAIVVIILYTFLALSLFVAKWNRSLKRMEVYLEDIGDGTFPTKPLIITGGDELSEMADVINAMNRSLIEKERMRNELELARTIQAELLPDDRKARELPANCRVSGSMTPAREVGGDLYDFFLIDPSHLGVVIADVSDKGAPAALFMATAKMCIKDNMMLGLAPGEVLDLVNNRLIENNKSGLFVTAWIGVIDLANGHLSFAMAGHPYPFLRRAAGGTWDELKSARNLVLAGFPDFEYLQSETDLLPGDRFLLYTDGLDEARSAAGDFFGKERIREVLDRCDSCSLSECVASLKDAVDTFASGREQSDDLTLLMVEYEGGNGNE